MTKISDSGYRFPPLIIQRAIWLYAGFTLSFRDVEGWRATSLSSSAARLRKRKGMINATAERIANMTVTVRPIRENHRPRLALWTF